MSSQIGQALLYGANAISIMHQLKKKYPQYAPLINKAEKAGYSPENILSQMVSQSDKSKNTKMTEREKTKERRSQQEKKATMTALAGAGAIAGIGWGMRAAAMRNAAVRPSQILPPLPGSAAPRGKPPQLPGGSPAQLAYNPQQPRGAPHQAPQSPQAPQGQPPQARPSQPGSVITPYEHNPETNISLIRNIGVEKQVATALQSGLGIAAIAQHLREQLPANKLSLMEKAPGGLEQALQDYLPVIKQQESEQSRQAALQKFNEKIRSPKQSLIQQETERLNQEYPQAPMILEQPRDVEPPPIRAPEDLKKDERLSKVAVQHLPSPVEAKPVNPSSFYIPNYKNPSESKEDFVKRTKLTDVLNKAAKLLTEGKTFLDLPIQKGARYSTASDVLRFLSGTPNIYDSLLSDDEKDEIFDSMLESGHATVEGLRPTMSDTAQSTLDEGNSYGAKLAPNFVWNMLLAIEPKISDLVPASIKGSKGKPAGGKMGTTEARRFLTHAVYGIMSGKKISNELADKINRISEATSHLDMMVKAVKAGNMLKAEKEMEALMDDEYFAQVMGQELDDLILSKEELEKKREFEKEDSRSAAAMKAARTRKMKKEQS